MSNFDTLASYLTSEEAHENSMGLSDLDGFLHGVACTPEPTDEWLEVALGTTEGIPAEILRMVVARFEEVAEGLAAQSGPIEPVFWQAKEGHVIAMDWCEGFMDAVKCRPVTWNKFSTTPIGAKLMLPIVVHMIDDEGNSMFQIPQEELDETLDTASEAIPSIVPPIYTENRNTAELAVRPH